MAPIGRLWSAPMAGAPMAVAPMAMISTGTTKTMLIGGLWSALMAVIGIDGSSIQRLPVQCCQDHVDGTDRKAVISTDGRDRHRRLQLAPMAGITTGTIKTMLMAIGRP
ncbi:uncharacterized protein L3040_008808 [Drepanopeziza brunnea f. sp. 'multigermtubi']|uniref:uncharacterized protein n=1 Tax=Drepanopeziza brunnea f. sp. 'multigermtubi' TaxID=698441 RepID=UPI002386A7E3|nr:hypothetical protein L3040_008808 [Drepanopeziza brunnea f. sp. 'multigermtubi']